MIFAIILFVLGAIVGSFLNVVIVRLGTGCSIVRGRSKCFSCGHKLVWYDVVPFFSYIFLGRKCRYCGSKISARYFVVELVTAVLFSATAFSGMPSTFLGLIFLLLSLSIISIFVAIAFYDFRHKIIPDVLSYAAALCALFFSVLTIISAGATWWRLLSGLIVASPFFFFWLVSKGKWMGLGDAKLSLSIGWWLGISLSLGALISAVFSGAIFGVGILFAEKIRAGNVKWGKHEIPFGPFLIFGALISYFFGVSIFTFIRL